MRNYYFLILGLIISSFFVTDYAFADHLTVTVNVARGTSVPGCETTNQCYSPYEVTVDVGGEVTWTNNDSAAHTVTSGSSADGPDGVFDSSLFMSGASFSHKFEAAGTYDYFCMVHPWMEGIVVVQESSTRPSPTPTPTPTPTIPRIPSGADIVVSAGSSVPGCDETRECYEPSRFTVGRGSTVTWFNADSAAHTVTSGTPSNGPDGVFDSSLFMSGASFSHRFDSDGTFPYFCMVHPWMEGYVIVQRGGPITSPTPTPVPTPTPTPASISVSTDSFEYNPTDLVTVNISTSTSTNVAISVTGPDGDSIVSRTVSTDSRGNGSLQFKLPDSSLDGSYRVDATATVSGQKVSDNTNFSVKSISARISIVSLQPTDQQGNPVSTFTKGKLGFVKVVLSSDSNTNSLVTINLFDSDLTSLGIGSFKTTLSSGNSEMTLSFFIPDDAQSGNADIYANVFSDWPSQGGVPLTGESSTQVRIQ